MAINAWSQNRRPTYELRPRPLKIGGVGRGEQVCYLDKRLPVALRTTNGTRVIHGEVLTPVVDSSSLPGLLGLNALRRNRAVLDFNTLQLHFCGPGNYDLQTGLPPGTESFQCEIAPSGHIVLPCCEYDTAPARDDYTPCRTEYSLTLVSHPDQPSHQATAAAAAAAPTAPVERSIPPPPCLPPRLPEIAPTVWQGPNFSGMLSRLRGALGNAPILNHEVAGSSPSVPRRRLVAAWPYERASSSGTASSSSAALS